MMLLNYRGYVLLLIEECWYFKVPLMSKWVSVLCHVLQEKEKYKKTRDVTLSCWSEEEAPLGHLKIREIAEKVVSGPQFPFLNLLVKRYPNCYYLACFFLAHFAEKKSNMLHLFCWWSQQLLPHFPTMGLKTWTHTQADDRFEGMESLGKSCSERETKLKAQSENGSETGGRQTKTSDNAVLIAAANFLVGNSLNALPKSALIPNFIIRFLILSVAIAFVSSVVSLRLHQKKVAAFFRYISLAFTASTSAILWYYLLVKPLWSRFINRNR